MLRKETVLHGKDGLPYEILATWREGKNKMIMESFDIYDILSPKKIRNIQNWLLDYIQRKGIIIEVLPTSNIMVGQYTSFSNYHILRKHTIFRLDAHYSQPYLCAVTFNNNDYGKRESKLPRGI